MLHTVMCCVPSWVARCHMLRTVMGCAPSCAAWHPAVNSALRCPPFPLGSLLLVLLYRLAFPRKRLHASQACQYKIVGRRSAFTMGMGPVITLLASVVFSIAFQADNSPACDSQP